MIRLGQVNRLEVIRNTSIGCMLDGADLGEVLLVPGQVSIDAQVGDDIEVFVYRDADHSLMATSTRPYVVAGRVACLEVVALTDKGAYLNWGLNFDLFMPRSEQLGDMRVGRRCVVYAMLDLNSDRVIATARLHEHLSEINEGQYREGQQVEVLVSQKTDLGFRVVIDRTHLGMLYHNEVFTAIEIGDLLPAFVKAVRDDNKIDLTLQQSGRRKIGKIEDKILQHLRSNGGKSHLTDKSPPDEIYRQFGVSKKVYKQALGSLYKARCIALNKRQITLIKPQ